MSKYSVGHLMMPATDDPRFDTEAEALAHAGEKGAKNYNTMLGVWHDESGELVAIVYEGTVFTS